MNVPRLNLDLSIPVIFDKLSQEYGDKLAVRQRRGDKWEDITWNQYRKDVRYVANGLISLGLQKGDKISILGINSYEWVVSDYASMSCGAVSVPLYVTASAEQLEYVADHSESKILVVQNRELLDKVSYFLVKLDKLEKIIMMRPTETDNPDILQFEEVKERGRDYAKEYPEELDDRIKELKPDDFMSIMYTSGTTGPPKGVMLTHRNATWTIDSLNQCFDIEQGKERILSYLPLSHIAERSITCFQSVVNAYLTHFGEGLNTLREDLLVARPTIMFGVPRVWKKFHKALQKRFSEEEGVKKKLIDWGLKVGREKVRRRQAGEEIGGWLKFRYNLADRLIFSKIREGVGLDEGRVVVSGAAPIYKDILEFFHAIGIPIREVYGQTEDTGPTTIHQWDRVKLGTVGQPIPGSEVKVAEDGEILVKGGHVFQGYFRSPKATAETLEGGWLHSGDIGVLDEDNFLTVTDRKKDLIITAGGKNIAPQNIENLLKSITYVSQAVVIGDRRKFLTALITLEPEAIQDWAKQQGISYQDYEDLVQNDRVREMIKGEVERINREELSRCQTIKDFRILKKDLSIEDGLLTPTLKVKRGPVIESYSDLVESMYEELMAAFEEEKAEGEGE